MLAKPTVLKLVTAGMLALTACAGESATAMTESSSVVPQPVSYSCADPATGSSTALGATLTADVSSVGNGVQVRYEVVNGGHAPVYVVQSLTHPAFTINYNPQNYYLSPGPDGVVEVAKREYWPPQTCLLPLTIVPPPPALAIRLEPGQRIGETFAVDRPLQVRNPYGDDVVSQLPPMPDPAQRFRFCIGVAATATPEPGAAFPKDRDYYRFARGQQQFLCSDTFDV